MTCDEARRFVEAAAGMWSGDWPELRDRARRLLAKREAVPAGQLSFEDTQ